MRLNKMRTIYLLLTVALLSSCSKKITPEKLGECTKYAIVSISRIEHVNDSIKVYFLVNNGCGQFNKFIEKDSAGAHIVTVQAVYKGCFCTMDIPERSASYKFKPTKSGTSFLTFRGVNGDDITETIDVK
ncbi:hypothetical protein SIO70_16740 [Chitinophaga sancti]|uniref:hypothetical protein n=1 Tax=Chitinophaga sancti TaxID=1004 RepID=UPI002A75E00B|nr:hypothetical protein [Chitinophaga sancti]WPQ66508.1 hypothetical protein SIO70_16740 [Chitinophaga sancti]